jgi:hypothetical protein
MRSLEDELTDLGDALDVPAGATVAAAVSRRLRAGGAVAGVARGPAALRRRWTIAIGAIAVAVVGGAIAAPAVADWFGVRGVEVTQGPPPSTTVAPPGPGAELDLGTRVGSVDDAAAAAGFRPVVPARLGAPKAIWVDRRGTLPFVSLVYDGVLVSQFDATIADDAIISKFAREDTVVEDLQVHGERALWIDGVHEVVLRGRDGRYSPEALRRSDAVLLVEHGPLTVRIESDAGRAEAVAIAESLPVRR